VLVELGAGAVHAVTLLATELELTAGLEGDRRLRAVQRHDAVVLDDRLPLVAFRQPPQDFLDATGERHRMAGLRPHRDLFVLRADTPTRARLARLLEEFDELRVALDEDRRTAISNVL